MFRFDNPDALLVLLLIGSVAATVRALESTRLRAEGLTAHPVGWLAVGGSQTNSILELTLGYNGLGRLTGNEVGSVGGGGGGAGGSRGATGILRMFGSEVGGQVAAWLVPAALVLLGAGLWFTRRAPVRTRSAPGSWCGAPGCW